MKRFRCYWGGYGHVQATMEGIKEIFTRKIGFDYAILLTGQDYPLNTNEQISGLFEQHLGKSFMEYFPMPSEVWGKNGMQRIELWHWRFSGGHLHFPRRKSQLLKRRFPDGYYPYGGSSYWCLTKDCLAYIHHFIQANKSFVNFFKYVDVPDEILFQTIVMNSHFAGSVVNDNLRFIQWSDDLSGSPDILTVQDLHKLATSPKIFARKFDLTVDPEVLDLIDNRLLEYDES